MGSISDKFLCHTLISATTEHNSVDTGRGGNSTSPTSQDDHLRWRHLLGKWQGLDQVPLPSVPQRLLRRIHNASMFLFPT